MKQPRWKRGTIYWIQFRDHAENRDAPPIMSMVGRLDRIGRVSLTFHYCWPEDEDMKPYRHNYSPFVLLRDQITAWREMT